MTSNNSFTFNLEPYDLYGSFYESIVGLELARRGLHHTFYGCFGYVPNLPAIIDQRELIASELYRNGRVLREVRLWDKGLVEMGRPLIDARVAGVVHLPLRRRSGGAIGLCVPPSSTRFEGPGAVSSAGRTVCNTSVAIFAVPTANANSPGSNSAGCIELDKALPCNVLCIAKGASAVLLKSLVMKDLNEAMTEITAIRRQIVRTAEFRGYGPITVAMTGLVAIAAAEVLARLLPAAAHDVVTYLTLWISTAAFATSLIGFEMVIRSRTIHSSLGPEMILHAVEQLVPSGVAGALVTAVLIRVAPETVWMLPGLWQILFSLGVFASARFLPRAVFAVAAWYLFAGLICLSWAATERMLSPWMMGLPYGVGQLLAAAILQWSETGTDGSFE